MNIAAPATVSIYGIDFVNGKTASSLQPGGINNHGSLTIMHSTFSGNIGDQGGAIRNSGVLTVIDGAFTGNSAADGGAILNDLEAMAVFDYSTFIKNC